MRLLKPLDGNSAHAAGIYRTGNDWLNRTANYIGFTHVYLNYHNPNDQIDSNRTVSMQAGGYVNSRAFYGIFSFDDRVVDGQGSTFTYSYSGSHMREPLYHALFPAPPSANGPQYGDVPCSHQPQKL